MNSAVCFSEAGLVLKQVDMTESVANYRKAANIYQVMGRASMAAKVYTEMAEIYDNDLLDRDNAIKCHISAGDCNRATKSEVSAQACFMKAADLMSLEGKFFEAVKQFESIAEYYSRQTAMPHHVNNCCYKAVLCMFVQEVKNEQKGKVVKTRERLLTYTSSYPTFDDHDDAKLCDELINHYENNDVEAFQAALTKRKYKLNQW
jgi:capsule polysaccharide export protein KpsE/RkpR